VRNQQSASSSKDDCFDEEFDSILCWFSLVLDLFFCFISYSLNFILSSFSHFGHCFGEMWLYSLGVHWFIATIILDTLFC
jgi:hypothetical protein